MTTMTQNTAAEIVAGTWTIDPTHSEVGFTVRHLMTKVRGHFEAFEGTLTTGEEVADTRAEATIETASITTRADQRDAHLRSADFFDVENHPQMSFRTVSFDGTTATGELTIRGITRPVHLEVEFLGRGNDPWGGDRLGLAATGEISRKDFGLDFNIPLEGGSVVIGDKVGLQISVQAVLAGQPDQA
ncbi:YceI family protein [Nocardioides insulae]|uniref:YceI family protein n=1 Tax=Nocardioides insulae TaxID=394734 RepID=UPI0004039587|nr:YceI family protein [Nocardioides insulae]